MGLLVFAVVVTQDAGSALLWRKWRPDLRPLYLSPFYTIKYKKHFVQFIFMPFQQLKTNY
jgi:hypothetical protein